MPATTGGASANVGPGDSSPKLNSPGRPSTPFCIGEATDRDEMKGREGKFGVVALLALLTLQLATACAAATQPADCGQRGVAVLSEIHSLVTFACDLEPRGRSFNRNIFTVAPTGAPARRLTSGYAQGV